MIAHRGPFARGGGVAWLTYWMLVVGGLLAAHRVLEHAAPARAVALWVGAVAGTAVGQGLAHARLRVRAILLLLPFISIAAFQVASFAWDLWGTTMDLELGLMAFVPASVCGYASLSERGGLVAFWFPATLWMLGVLDGASGADAESFGGAQGWILLSALAALFVGFLGSREARRLALWQTHGAEPLAQPPARKTLRRSPARSVGQTVWMASTAVATLALTAWVAPSLWQEDVAHAHRAPQPAIAQVSQAAGGSGGLPCCESAADAQDADREGRRLRDYFPLLPAYGDAVGAGGGVAFVPGVSPTSCVACGGDGGGPIAAVGDSCSDDAPAPIAVEPMSLPIHLAASDPLPASTTATPPRPKPEGTNPAGEPPSPSAPGATAHPPPAAPRVAPEPPSLAPAPIAPAHPRVPPPGVILPASAAWVLDPLRWLLALVASAIAVQIAMRPMRRLIALRHLRRSLWAEAIDQRISNLWHLALVGLRDAGWNVRGGDDESDPRESPHELARRVGLPGVERCAEVLDRCRHGVRVDDADLAAMTEGATAAYAAARQRAGFTSRLLSWLRWPLL